jgi:hypothetical protein
MSHSHCSAVEGSCLAIRRQHRWVGHTVRVATALQSGIRAIIDVSVWSNDR